MLENLSREQIEGIFDAMPVDFLFVDENEKIRFWNRTDKRKRPAPVDKLGMDIRGCHGRGLPLMEEFVADLKSGKKDEVEFWIRGEDRKILNRFIAVRDKSGKYLGILQYLLDFTSFQELAEAKKGAHRQPSE